MRTMLRLSGVALVTFPAYLLLAGQVSMSEAATAAVLTLLLLAWYARDIHGTAALVRPADHVRHWGSALGRLPMATARTALVLARAALFGGSPGKALAIRFDHGRIADRAAAARRSTALLTASLAPDSFVVRMPPGRDEALIHAIVPPPHAPDQRWLS